MERIPILQMGDFLLVTIQVDMHDQLALTLQDDLSERICKTSARGVLIDISALDMVDSFIGRMIGTISGLSKIMDAQTVLVGMQPAVAITLVELGLTLPGVSTALNVERGNVDQHAMGAILDDARRQIILQRHRQPVVHVDLDRDQQQVAHFQNRNPVHAGLSWRWRCTALTRQRA